MTSMKTSIFIHCPGSILTTLLMVDFIFCDCFSASRSAVKLKLELNGFNFNQCAGIYRPFGINLTNGTQLCAGGEEGKDSCSGDSGDLIAF